jgi:hypothetical protein
MNRLLSSLALVSMLLQPYSGAIAQSNDPVPGPRPGSVANTSEQRSFRLEQETSAFDLEHKEVEPIFETQQVPDTCYRQVQRGMKTECHNEYDQQCSTRIENECRNIPYPVCQNVPRQVCQNVPRNECRNVPQQVCQTVNERQCRNEPQRVCTNVPRRQCSTTQQCTTQNDSVCRGTPPNQTCQNVPRRVCNPVEQCSTVNDSVCHTEDRQVCNNVPRQQCRTENRQECRTVNDSVCHTENQQQCHDEYRQECQNVPRQSCVDVPRQVCEQVPNMESEAYACTRDVQVQTGERTKLRVAANVKVIVTNFGRVQLNTDELILKLSGADVTLSLGQSSQKLIYRVVKKDRIEQAISANEKQLQVTFYLEVVSLEQLSTAGALKIVEPKLFFDKIQFKLNSPELANFVIFTQGHLKLVMVKGRRLYIQINDAFDPAQVLKKTADGYEISFSRFQMQSLSSREYQINFELGVKTNLNRNELLNPELLDRVSLQSVAGEFDGFPTN